MHCECQHKPGELRCAQVVPEAPREEQARKLEGLIAPVVLQPQTQKGPCKQRCEERKRDETEEPGALPMIKRSWVDCYARVLPPADVEDEDPQHKCRQQVAQLLGNEADDVEPPVGPRERVPLLGRVFKRREVVLDDPADVRRDDRHCHGRGEDHPAADGGRAELTAQPHGKQNADQRHDGLVLG